MWWNRGRLQPSGLNSHLRPSRRRPAMAQVSLGTPGLPPFPSSFLLVASLFFWYFCVSLPCSLGPCLILKVFEWAGWRRPAAQPFSLPSDTFIATLCHVTSLCVLELGARKWVAAWTFIVGPLQFNLGNAGTIVCKDFHALLVFCVFFFFF